MFLQSTEEIKNWLDKYQIKNYSINDDLTVDVDGDVDLNNLHYVNLYNKPLTNIPVKFNIVLGNFDCSYNELTSLQGAPKEVGGSFYCHSNNLTSLQFAPKEVVGNFYCHRNDLTALQGALKEVGGDFFCDNNKLISLQFAPKVVGGYFICYHNQLTTIRGCPKNKLKQIIEYYPHLIHTLTTEDLLLVI
jgi:hypothetical protein